MTTSAKRPNSRPARAQRATPQSVAVVETAPTSNAPLNAAPMQLQAFRAESGGPFIAVHPTQPAPGSTEPRFVASLMSAARLAAYNAMAVQAGPAAVTRLPQNSPPHSHWFLVPVQGFASSPSAIDHLKARVEFVARSDRRLMALLAAEQLERA